MNPAIEVRYLSVIGSLDYFGSIDCLLSLNVLLTYGFKVNYLEKKYLFSLFVELKIF